MARCRATSRFLFALGLGSSAAAIFWISAPAEAQFAFLEPYAGVGQVQISVYNSAYNDYADKDIATGFMLGIKGGYAFTPRFFMGLDYQTGGPYQFGRIANNGDWTLRMLGGGLGLDYDVARFWAGYYFDVEIDDSQNSTKYRGTGFKVGFGLKVAKNVHANLDVALESINTSQMSTGDQTQNLSHPPNVTVVFASISLPIELK